MHLFKNIIFLQPECTFNKWHESKKGWQIKNTANPHILLWNIILSASQSSWHFLESELDYKKPLERSKRLLVYYSVWKVILLFRLTVWRVRKQTQLWTKQLKVQGLKSSFFVMSGCFIKQMVPFHLQLKKSYKIPQQDHPHLFWSHMRCCTVHVI